MQHSFDYAAALDTRGAESHGHLGLAAIGARVAWCGAAVDSGDEELGDVQPAVVVLASGLFAPAYRAAGECRVFEAAATPCPFAAKREAELAMRRAAVVG